MMKTSGIKRKSYIINNIEYLIRKTGENKTSLALHSGVTRTTLYKILEGKVNNVQNSTITRIADFFGVQCDVIEHYDIEELDKVDSTLSVVGNRNPAAVPMIPQSQLLPSMDMRIGQLVTKYPVTWAFEDGANLIALVVEQEIQKTFFPGDILILKRYSTLQDKQPCLFYNPGKGLYIREPHHTRQEIAFSSVNDKLIGTIIEERLPENITE
ncbi:helix-turn-helix domain-containing protein [Erwinia mallotivora]|uniref:helix-turn-helix domain-containing protein n=1 Tax=Erwinia mallotivora TaxID=69222 RepID=UPI0035EAF857